MAVDFKLPEIGEGTAEGEIIKWLVAVGDVVEEDTPLVEVMTDKATVEIPSPGPGVVAELRAAEGDVVDVGAVIMVFGDAAGAPAAPVTSPAPVAESAAKPAAGAPSTVPETPVTSPPPTGVAQRQVDAAQAEARAELADGDREEWEAPAPGAGRGHATPATRRLAREMGIDLAGVRGSGRGGLVMKEDLEGLASGAATPGDVAAMDAGAIAKAVSHMAPGAVSGAGTSAPGPSAPPEGAAAGSAEPLAASAPETVSESVAVDGGTASPQLEERVPFRGLRRRIAERLVAAKRTVPHFTYVEECDASQIVELRARAKKLGAAHGVKVTYLPFFIKAMVEAAKQHPILNSSLDEERNELVYKHYYNVGIATDTSRGLVVPVVKNADRLSIFELAREIERLAGAAREGRSSMEDLTGGTMTITSTGNIGGVLATPIINHPEVAILGVTAIRPRPVVRDGEIVIRQMVNLAISLDHRVVDGAPGAIFMRDLVALLEDPKLQVLGHP
jgi:pyruvate dehydrogenase E2 component (dihydrolipoamide acetyltransferase)